MLGRRVLRRRGARSAIGGLAVGLVALAALAIQSSNATASTTAHVRAYNEVSAHWGNISAKIGIEHAALNDFLANGGAGFHRDLLVAAVDSADPDFTWLIDHTDSAESTRAKMTSYQYAVYNQIVGDILRAASDGGSDLGGLGQLASSAFARLSDQVVANVQRRQRDLAAYLQRVDRRNALLRRANTVVLVLFDVPLWLVCAVVLVGYQRRAEREAADQRHRAMHDALTDLPNRAMFLEQLDQATERADRYPDHTFAVVFLDLNGFKIINDSLGHQVGDDVLVRVAERLVAGVRIGDVVSRFGGDEFVLLLNDVGDVSDLSTSLTRILSAISEPMMIDGRSLAVGAAAGVVASTAGRRAAEDYLRDADTAMYQAKNSGNGSFVLFDGSMHAGVVKRLQIESDLRHAIDDDQFELYYQPILRLHDRCVVGMEALIRWHHPERGMVGPSEFLPVAEATGLIRDIGRWTISTACRQIRSWLAASPAYRNLTVSINLSNRQFWDPELRPFLHKALEESELPASMLVFEVTEGVIMHNRDMAGDLMRQLRNDAIKLHIDDFGTGHSSLAALHGFPIDALKIDRSFVNRMRYDTRSYELVRIMIDMGSALGIEVIAEGIENEREAEILADLGCPLVQGHLFSRPIPAAEVPRRFPPTALSRPAAAA